MEETDLFPCEDLPTPLCEALADRLPVISFAHDVRHNLYFECELQLSQMYANQEVLLCPGCLIIGNSNPPTEMAANLTLHIELRDLNDIPIKQ